MVSHGKQMQFDNYKSEREKNQLKTTQDLGFNPPSFYDEDKDKFMKKKKSNSTQRGYVSSLEGSKQKITQIISDNIDFTNKTSQYQPHLMRRSSAGGTTFPNASQLNFELNLRDMSYGTNNILDTTKIQQESKWNWPPRQHNFKRFDDKYTTPRIDDLAAIPKLGPEQIKKLRVYQDKLMEKNHNEMRHLYETTYKKQTAHWITTLRETIYEKQNKQAKELVNSTKRLDQLKQITRIQKYSQL